MGLPLLVMRRCTVKDDLERKLRAIVPQYYGGHDTFHPGAPHDCEHTVLMAVEPVVLAFASLQDKCFEVAEVVVDNRIDLPGIRIVFVLARAAGMPRVSRMTRMPRMSRMTRIAG